MTVCPLCNRESQERLHLPHTTIWECQNSQCGLRFAVPQFDDIQLQAAYEKHYYPRSNNESTDIHVNTPTIVLRQVFDTVSRHLDGMAGRSLLDYGCGTGNLCRLAREFGMDVVGIESDQAARTQTSTALSIEVFGRLSDLQRTHSDRQFDLICLWDSIEHLRSPWTDLAALRDFLKPDGRILISTPNAESLRARVLSSGWESYVNPTHFYYFTRTSLRATLVDSGYTSIEEWHCPVRYQNHGILRGWWQSALQSLRLSGELVFVAQRWVGDP
jgi:2-polyprenyl-3-methyl-5-hydroxy-6-metoxy-1,4-benzoquinol methylase